MEARIARYFEENGIEFFAALDYKDCIEARGDIAEREDFTPRSAIVYLLPYYAGETENLSRYAASLDYHIILREVGEGLIAALREAYPNARARSYGDHSPIAECHAALISGLGIKGDNGLLINERYGSYVFVGDVLTDLPPEALGAIKPLPVSSCMHCGACKRECPTGILRGEGEDCLSAVTQRKGELSAAERDMMRKYNTAWGCDLCQSACPYNREPRMTPIEFFHRDRITRLDACSVGEMPKAEFSRRAFAWRGRNTVLRNLAILGEENT